MLMMYFYLPFRVDQLPAGTCRPIMATICVRAEEVKCQSVKVATNVLRNLSAPDAPANGIAVVNVRYVQRISRFNREKGSCLTTIFVACR